MRIFKETFGTVKRLLPAASWKDRVQAEGHVIAVKQEGRESRQGEVPALQEGVQGSLVEEGCSRKVLMGTGLVAAHQRPRRNRLHVRPSCVRSVGG